MRLGQGSLLDGVHRIDVVAQLIHVHPGIALAIVGHVADHRDAKAVGYGAAIVEGDAGGLVGIHHHAGTATAGRLVQGRTVLGRRQTATQAGADRGVFALHAVGIEADRPDVAVVVVVTPRHGVTVALHARPS